MCYTSAAAAKKAGIQALQHGVLILLVPPLLMFLAIFWVAFRRRDSLEGEGVASLEESDLGQVGSGRPDLNEFGHGTLFPNSASSNRIEDSAGQTFRVE